METLALELIEDVIFWERHTEIYESLESILRDKYIVSQNKTEHEFFEKDGIKAAIMFFMNAQMENEEDYRTLELEFASQFDIKLRNQPESDDRLCHCSADKEPHYHNKVKNAH